MKNEFYEALIEHDLNPFILFDSNGKMKDFNREAEFLFNYVQPNELYDLAVSYASLSFGFNQKFVSLKYGKLKFYALLVGYINDNEIGLRLYKEVSPIEEISMGEDIEFANIFSLIELSKSTTLLTANINIIETYDISIPELKININDFLLILNECFSLFKYVETLNLKVYIKTGEYSMINNKKYQIVSIEFFSNDSIELTDFLNKKDIFIEDNILKFEFPMIY